MTADQRAKLTVIRDVLMEQQSRLEAFTVDCPEALDAFERLDECTDEVYYLLGDQEVTA